MPSAASPRPLPKGLLFFSIALVVAVIVLIAVGAQVTSRNAGMSVPDWPTSYGYNMLALPFNRWLVGTFWTNPIFWEHSHRLFAGTVGVLTIGLTVAVWTFDPRRWMRWVALGAVFLVCLQGLLGGLRVVLAQDMIGVFHAALAQLFLLTVGFIALSYTRGWNRLPSHGGRLPRQWQRGLHIVAGLIFVQLLLGAAMRHQHHGLSIPDFPTAYRHLWPHITPERLAGINALRVADGQPPTSVGQIELQLCHRLTAFLIFCGVLVFSLAIFRCRQSPPRLRNLAIIWLTLTCIQVSLGAATIWTGKNPVVASAHVVTGAVLLLVASHMAILVSRWRRMGQEAAAAALAEAAPVS